MKNENADMYYAITIGLCLAALVLAFFASPAKALKKVETPPCNAFVYDMIYKSIIQEVIDEDLTNAAFSRRNTAIETLRSLCRGQRPDFDKWHSIDLLKDQAYAVAY